MKTKLIKLLGSITALGIIGVSAPIILSSCGDKTTYSLQADGELNKTNNVVTVSIVDNKGETIKTGSATWKLITNAGGAVEMGSSVMNPYECTLVLDIDAVVPEGTKIKLECNFTFKQDKNQTVNGTFNVSAETPSVDYNVTGTNWCNGYQSGTITMQLNDNGTAVIVDNNDYTCTNLVIPDVVKSGNNYYNVVKVADLALCSTGHEYYKPGDPALHNGTASLTGSLTFPNTLEEIGAYAFADSWYLNSDLIIPASCNKIGDGSFTNYASASGSNLTLDTKTTSIPTIGMGAFAASGIRSVPFTNLVFRFYSNQYDVVIDHLGSGCLAVTPNPSGVIKAPGAMAYFLKQTAKFGVPNNFQYESIGIEQLHDSNLQR